MRSASAERSSGGDAAAPPHSATDALVLAALKVGLAAWVLGHGFSHVSDDDYARTVIAQQFAHAPRLDPSGTSWLPLPFWIAGGVMAAAGASLHVARVLAVVLSALSVAAPYAALRILGTGRAASLGAVTVAMALPWNAWLGAATVPEGWVGALVGAALIAMPVERARPWCAIALLAASLSRYEAWPACVAFGVVSALRVRHERARGDRARGLGWAAVALAGVAGWMLWNAHAHGSALHFVSRVRAFRQAVGAADVPLADKLLGYPRSLGRETPEALLLTFVGAAGVLADRRLRARWLCALGGALAIVVFLVVGDVRDGAPTHHAARALDAVWWVAAGCGADALEAAWSAARAGAMRAAVRVATGIAGATWLALLPARWADAPGRTPSENREPQIARGEDLARRDVASIDVTPCSFEHFALLAAWGHPERATVHTRTGAPPTPDCPALVER